MEAGWAFLGQFDLGGGLDQSGLVDDHQGGLGTLKLSGAVINVGLVLSF